MNFYKKPAVARPDPVDELLLQLGARVATARLARDVSKEQLALDAGIGLSTLAKIEKGSPTVQIGSWLKVLQALSLLQTAEQIATLEQDPITTSHLLERVRKRASKKK